MQNIPINIAQFNGISNRGSDFHKFGPDELKSKTMPLSEALNVDLTKRKSLQRRKGYTKLKTGSYKNAIRILGNIYARKGDTIVKLVLSPDAVSEQVLYSGLRGEDTALENCYNNLVFSDGLIIDRIDPSGNYYHIPEQSTPAPGEIVSLGMGTITTETPQMFRRIMPGHILCFYKNVLYVAYQNYLAYSEAGSYIRYDARSDPFAFPAPLTMVMKAGNGLFISDGLNVYFYEGDSPMKLKAETLLAVGATKGSARQVYDFYIPAIQKVFSEGVIFEAGGEIYFGGNGGFLFKLNDVYDFPFNAATASGMLYRKDDLYQYRLKIR